LLSARESHQGTASPVIGPKMSHQVISESSWRRSWRFRAHSLVWTPALFRDVVHRLFGSIRLIQCMQLL
ncbi:unnamed protein product, partial [Mycena citricolor]